MTANCISKGGPSLRFSRSPSFTLHDRAARARRTASRSTLRRGRSACDGQSIRVWSRRSSGVLEFAGYAQTFAGHFFFIELEGLAGLREAAASCVNDGRAPVVSSRAVPTDILHFPARVVVTLDATARIVLEELSGVSERPMIIRMTTTARPQQRYDHRLRDLVQRTGDLTIATDLGVPRSTARGWLRTAPTVVVSLEVADLTEPELRQEVLKLRRRVEKLAALLRLALALLHTSGFRLAGARLPDGRAKLRILRAVDRARECIPLRAVLRFLRLSPSRFHAWRRRQHACALDDQSSCPRTSPHRLTRIRGPGDRGHGDLARVPHVPTGTLAVLAQRLGTVWRPPRPGTASCGSSAGDAPGSACIRRSRRWAFARREPTRCGTSTPPSSACSTGPAPICTP